PVAYHPLHVRDGGHAAVRALLRVADAHDVVRARAAEVGGPDTLLLVSHARVHDLPCTAHGDLVAERRVVTIRRRARAVEEENVAGIAGKDVEARAAECARL